MADFKISELDPAIATDYVDTTILPATSGNDTTTKKVSLTDLYDEYIAAKLPVLVNASNKYISSGSFGIGTSIPSEALEVVGNIALTGTVDGRDVAADGTKLDGIEAGATADQSAAEVSYSNTTSGLTATDVQAAIDEVAASSGGGGSAGVSITVTQANSFSVGDAIYLDDSDSTWKLAQADASDTLALGIVSAATGANFTVNQAGQVTGLTGLTTGEYYFLSGSVAGGLSSLDNATYSQPLLFATAATTGLVVPYRPSSNGGAATLKKVTTTAVNYTIQDDDEIVLVTAGVTLTLPAAGSGKNVTIKKNTTSNITINPVSGTIDGETSITLGGQYSSLAFFNDGVSWFITT